jgi:hypothetical protein
MQVRVTKHGFIYGQYRKPGDKLTLVDVEAKDGTYKAKDQFSKNWMVELEVKPIKKSKAKPKKDEA